MVFLARRWMCRFFPILLLLCNAGCSHLFYYPADSNYYYPPKQLGYFPEEIRFRSLDGTELHGWLFRAKKSKGLIIQFHGNAENITSHYTSLVWLTKQGYDLFTFDYRGYGSSRGEASQEDIYKDALAALKKAWELRRPGSKFVVYGQSLGGVISMRAFVDFELREKTDLVVMDSTFTSYKDLAQETMAKSWLTWILSPLGQVLVSDKYASDKVMDRFHGNLLVIHDKKDPVVKVRNGWHLFDLAKNARKKDFWELDRGRHVGVFMNDTLENRTRFVKLLERL